MHTRGSLDTVECARAGGPLAEWIGDAAPDGAQQLFERAHGDANAARAILWKYVVERQCERDAVPIADETGFAKKGGHSWVWRAPVQC
jgi:SRSO17 transposase